jgi:hypothetical protein
MRICSIWIQPLQGHRLYRYSASPTQLVTSNAILGDFAYASRLWHVGDGERDIWAMIHMFGDEMDECGVWRTVWTRDESDW